MKLQNIAAASLLLVPLSFAGLTESATAADTHILVVRGSITAIAPGGDGDVIKSRNFNFDLKLTHTDPRRTLKRFVCASDARAELIVDVEVTSGEGLLVHPRLSLYEGAWCGTGDREGTAEERPHVIAFANSRDYYLLQDTHEFLSNDRAIAKFAIMNDAPPDAPSHVTAKRLSTISLKRTVAIEWKDNSNNETGFEIRNNTVGHGKIVGPNTTRVVWGGLDPKMRQCFNVRAVGTVGISRWSPGLRSPWLPVCVSAAK